MRNGNGRENLFTYKICLRRAVYLNPNAYGIFELIELLERKEINLPKSFLQGIMCVCVCLHINIQYIRQENEKIFYR